MASRKELIAVDPLFFLQAADDALLDRSVFEADLPVRVQNIFRVHRVLSIRDVARLGSRGLLRFPSMGTKSVVDTVKAIETLIATPRPASATREPANVLDRRHAHRGEQCSQFEAANIREAFELAVAAIPATWRRVLTDRLGISGSPLTLAAIATSLNLTRQRVQQIEEKATRLAGSKSGWAKEMTARLESLLAGRISPLFVAGIEHLETWFKGFEANSELLGRVIEKFSSGELSCFYLGGLLIVARASEEDIATSRKNLTAAFKDMAAAAPTRLQMKLLTEAFLHQSGATELALEILESVETELQAKYSSADWDGKLISIGTSKASTLRTILAESTKALHYRKVAALYAFRTGTKINERAVHATLGTDGTYLLGRGTYGVWSHVGIGDKEASQIADTVLSIVDKSERQWHADELISILQSKNRALARKLDRYRLGAVIDRFRPVRDLGRHMYASKSRGNQAPRVEIHEACIEILKSVGHPLSTKALMRKISKYRGLGRHFQIFPRDNLVRVGSAKWGLAEWRKGKVGP